MEHEIREQPLQRGRALRHAGELLLVVASPLVFLADLQVSYALVTWSCRSGVLLPLHLSSLASLLLVLGCGAVSWRVWRSGGGEWPGEEVARGTRERFLGLLGVVTSLFFAVLVVALAVPRFILYPCQ